MSIESRSRQYGVVFDHWQIKDFLGSGSGGKSAVFRLSRMDSSWGKSALKVINLIEEKGNIDTISDYRRREYDQAMAECKKSAEQEVLLMDELHGNTNIVDYLDHKFVTWSDEFGFGCDMLIRMELLEDLRGRLRDGQQFSEGEVLKIGRDICTALVLCHNKGILHRDIKPENIFINSDGNFKLGDFGVSRILSSAPTAVASTGIGTPEYAAPEQFTGRHDKRVDIYSLGLVLYELSNGNRLPFASTGYARPMDVQRRQMGEPLPAPCSASRALAEVILKACAYRKEDRYQTAEEFLTALNRLSGSDTPLPLSAPPIRTPQLLSIPGNHNATQYTSGSADQNATPYTSAPADQNATQYTSAPADQNATQYAAAPADYNATQYAAAPADYNATQYAAAPADYNATQYASSPADRNATQYASSGSRNTVYADPGTAPKAAHQTSLPGKARKPAVIIAAAAGLVLLCLGLLFLGGRGSKEAEPEQTEAAHVHNWVEATCTGSRYCDICGQTSGEPLGHSWAEATCTSPRTCLVCGQISGEAMGHSWAEATYEAPKTCMECGLTEGTALRPDPKPLSEFAFSAIEGKIWIRSTPPYYDGGYHTKSDAPECWKDWSKPVYTGGTVRDNMGNEYAHGIHIDGWDSGVYYYEIRLDGLYTTFSGVCACPEKSATIIDYVYDTSKKNTKYFEVYGDGKLLFTSATMRYDYEPQEFSIDVTGVQVLKILYPATKGPNETATLYDGLLS